MTDFKDIMNKDGFTVSATVQGTGAQTAANYGIFFIAPFKCAVVDIQEVHQVKGTDGSDVSLNVEKLTGTVSVGSGEELLSTAFNLKGDDYVVQEGVLVKTNSVILERGDKLSLKRTGTLTSLVGVTATVKLIPVGKGHYL